MDQNPFSRRRFLSNGSLLLAAPGALMQAAELASAEGSPRSEIPRDGQRPELRIGLVTDLHYADKDPRGQRHYRDSAAKLREAVDNFNRSQVQAVVELGDLIDKASSLEEEIEWLGAINAVYSQVDAPRHYVLGNHCVNTLTKREFTQRSGARPETFYSFDLGAWHFVVLDACFTSSGEPYGRENFDWRDSSLPAAELDWLRQDLATTLKPVVVFAHQRLDPTEHYTIRNAEAVRSILERSGRVAAVFQGHSHHNDYALLNGIHYCTLVALVEGAGLENGGYGVLEIFPDHSLRVSGFRRQASHGFGRQGRA